MPWAADRVAGQARAAACCVPEAGSTPMAGPAIAPVLPKGGRGAKGGPLPKGAYRRCCLWKLVSTFAGHLLAFVALPTVRYARLDA